MGLSGALLVHEDAWISLPHSGDAQVTDTARIAAAVGRVMTAPGDKPQRILFASDSFGLHRLSFGKDAGAYTDQAGNVVTRWQSEWQRPEVWLFDFHHHLLAGDTGETVLGVVALCGLFFVISGVVLWWRTRKTFEFRALPKRMSRTAILRHHRDLGIVFAPLLAMVIYTGVGMIFRPTTALVLGPGAPAAIQAAGRAPKAPSAKLSETFDWGAAIRTAREKFPDAELRVLSLPRKDEGLVNLRMKQPAEWTTNGRTTLYFAADTGRLIATRDALKLSPQAAGYAMFYPLHAAKVGGLAYRIVITLVGLALMLLGSLAVWTFWFKRPRSVTAKAIAAQAI